MNRGLIVQSTRVVLPDGIRPAAIHIEDGRIVRVADAARDAGKGAPGVERTIADFEDLVILPGLVDTHVHVNEPGRAAWEGFDTATRAAAAGGVTTIVDMPLNSVPATTTVAALDAKRACAHGQAHVDVAFWGGIVPGNAGELEPLIDAGVRGFKCFLGPSGVEEFPAVGERDLREALPILARRDLPLLVHAEDPSVIARAAGSAARAAHRPQTTYAAYLSSRPPEAEVRAIESMVRFAREFDVRVHIVHVACAEAVDIIVQAKRDGVRVTGETCPHYLIFAAEQIPDGATEYKCAPPIREARHRSALWAALFAGALDLVATDHSPAPPSLKCPGDFGRAWGGIASLELSIAAVWTGASAWRGATDDGTILRSLVRWMSERPAGLAGLSAKGRIAPGYDADLAIWDPEAETTVDPMQLQQRHKLTPYACERLRGLVHATFVRGECVWRDGRIAQAAGGRLL